ncbi:zinc ribbon domain-containing protein [candidate division KSB1 bacterium]|nr:zinc ribbon domain-containing protein [candidate division KSB1 bacterium]
MPTYEYRCDECGHEFEKFQSITDEPIKICPVCEGTVTKKLSGGSGIIFKGSGFYQTDYKKSSCCSHEHKSESCDSPKKCCEGGNCGHAH